MRNMDNKQFDSFDNGYVDTYGNIPKLKIEDLKKKDENLPIKFSMIISFTNYRREQLARSLETLARQSFRDFEVLICDVGSTQDMESIYQIYEPYLRMKVKRIERNHFSADVTRGIVEVLPDVNGDVIGTMQPEMMLHPNCLDYLYYGHYKEMSNVLKHKINNSEITEEDETYVSIKNGFLSNKITKELDQLDWHSNIENIEKHPEYWSHGEGLSNWSNKKHLEHEPHKKWIWWFVSSAKKTATIWEDMPKGDGHALIDFYLIHYRNLMNYVDVCPQHILAYHQEHIRASVSPDRDMWIQNIDSVKKYLQEIGRL